MTNFGKFVLESSQCQKCIDKGCWVSWHWLREPEILSSYILEVLLRLVWCRMNAPNYQQNEAFLENFSILPSTLKVHRQGLWVSLVLVMWLRNYQLLYFGSFTRVGVMSPRIINIMTDFQKFFRDLSQC